MTPPPAEERTEVGNYFVSNYPPFSCWSSEELPAVEAALDRPAEPGVPLGLYLHVPFCRKRCKVCYFRVYTDTSSRDVEHYLPALARGVNTLGKHLVYEAVAEAFGIPYTPFEDAVGSV